MRLRTTIDPGESKTSERGAIILLVAAALVVLVAMVGLALDAGQLYVAKQKAQAAADAAAQAGVLDLYDRASPGAARTTATAYALMNGFSNTETAVNTNIDCSSQPWCNGHVTLSGEDNPNIVEVTISRQVNTSFLSVLGIGASTVTATADAAVVLAPAPLPIVITHPSLAGSFSLGGNTLVKICGGPARAIQVNSSSSSALSVGGGGTVDLSKGGPNDDGNCTTGTGSDFGVIGGPTYAGFPSWLTPLGSTEHFWQPDSLIDDPLSGVAQPTAPSVLNPPKVPVAAGTLGCPASPPQACQMYSPGTYTNGIDVKKEYAIFKPGLYYMDNGNGFATDSNGYMRMCNGCAADSATGSGMVVFNHGGGSFSVGSNGDVSLLGSDTGTIYRGILFFQDRNAPSATHALGGGGNLSLSGTLYLTNCDSRDTDCVGLPMTPSRYQTLQIKGGACSSTQIRGEIIASAVDLRGGGCIQMTLSPAKLPNIRSVALIR